MSDININPTADTPEIRSGTFIRTADGTGWVPIPGSEDKPATTGTDTSPESAIVKMPATRTAPVSVTHKGFGTSEFLLSVAGIIAATVLLLLHRITSAEWSTMTGINAGVYTIGRSLLKGWTGAQS